MKSAIQTCLLAASLTLASYSFAQVTAPAADEAKPKAEPTPQQQKIADLIKQLGADDFAKRDEASDELQKIGAEALPALREALKNDDPSVRSYAEWLVSKLEGRRDPRRNAAQLKAQQQLGIAGGGGFANVGGAGGGRLQLVAPRGGNLNVRVAAGNGMKTTSIQDGDRQITIQEDANGIRMTVTETTKDAKREQHDYEAKSIEDLRKDQPEAAQIYDQYTNRVRNLGGVNPGVLRLAPPAIDGGLDVKIQDRLLEARQLQEKAMIERDLRLKDFINAQNRNVKDQQVDQLKAETEALEAQLAQIEALHKQLLERTKAAQQRLAELEKQQQEKK